MSRRLIEGSQDIRRGHWQTWEPLGWIGLDLRHKTVGIVGLGRIGLAVAKRLHGGWGMRVLYTSRDPRPAAEAELAAERVTLEDLLRLSDFISLHIALNSETHNLIGPREIGLMKREAVLINTARGGIIDQAALVDALREKRIFGAGLDVCTPEPLPVNHPLLSLPNCLVVPHIGSATSAARNAMAERAAQNIIAGLTGHSLPFPVMNDRS